MSTAACLSRGALAAAFVLLGICTASAQAATSPETSSRVEDVYVGAQFGALVASHWRAYDAVDGSGSQNGGFVAGYAYRTRRGLVFGGETDINFGAEPAPSALRETPELFGSVRGRLGYASGPWRIFGTGGLAWTRDRVPAAMATDASTAPLFSQHAGWTAGVGLARTIDARWTLDAEYLFARFGSALSTNQLQAGLRYSLDADPRFPSDAHRITALDTGAWNVHGQTTLVAQYSAPFHAPYRGTNSLDPDIARETWDVTFYVGRRLWKGAALWVNPEIDQGFGLSNTVGVAGFTSGEAYKLGYAHPYIRVPRAFVQQTVSLGGAAETVDAGLNQFRDSRTGDRLVATIGKVSVSDVFDTISYAHDPRNDFMNWSLADAATFDYAADAWGFTYGAALEWYQGRWVARAGLFDLSQVPNSADLDAGFRQYQVVYEAEHQHTVNGQPGKVALVGFVSRGRMGRYRDALAAVARTGTAPDTSDVRRYGTRPGVNVNAAQQLVPDVGVFARVGWANGDVEPYEFTDIDRTASAGASFGGRRWGRSNDTLGIASVLNDVSAVHRAYLAAGGLGILVGDGRLPHPGVESIVESYYRLPIGPWQFTADYQFVVNPAFNRDRGPVSVFSARVRAQF